MKDATSEFVTIRLSLSQFSCLSSSYWSAIPTNPVAAPPPPPKTSVKEKSTVEAASAVSSSSAVPPPPPVPTLPSNSSRVPSAPPPPLMSGKGGSTPGIPPPPAPPLVKVCLPRAISSNSQQTKKLKPLHWLKLIGAVRGLKSKRVLLVNHMRGLNREIMLSKVKVPLQDLMSSVLDLEHSALDADQVHNLIKFCPTKEEMDLLKGYNGDKEKLGKCEQFFLELMKVPRVEDKLRVFLFKIQFQTQVSDLKNSLNVVNSTAEEVSLTMNITADLQSLFTWNTKQVFSFVAAEYKTSKNSLNQVCVGGAYMAYTTREAFKGKFVSDL